MEKLFERDHSVASPEACEPRSRYVTGEDSATLHYRLFNDDPGKPGLLLLHGMMAHSHWWDDIAPAFLSGFRVVAMDLPGMGDSEHRKEYRLRKIAADILTVVQHADLAPATIVAHSFSGNPALHACAQMPDLIDRLVCIDSRLFIPGIPTVAVENRPDLNVGRKFYPSLDEGVARFRLFNKGDVPQERMHALARQGLKQMSEGWTWKFDPGFDPEMSNDLERWIPDNISTPVDYIFGEKSELDGETVAGLLKQRVANCGEPIALGGVGHNMQLEAPGIVIAALKGLFARPAPRSALIESAVRRSSHA